MDRRNEIPSSNSRSHKLKILSWTTFSVFAFMFREEVVLIKKNRKLLCSFLNGYCRKCFNNSTFAICVYAITHFDRPLFQPLHCNNNFFVYFLSHWTQSFSEHIFFIEVRNTDYKNFQVFTPRIAQWISCFLSGVIYIIQPLCVPYNNKENSRALSLFVTIFFWGIFVARVNWSHKISDKDLLSFFDTK